MDSAECADDEHVSHKVKQRGPPSCARWPRVQVKKAVEARRSTGVASGRSSMAHTALTTKCVSGVSELE